MHNKLPVLVLIFLGLLISGLFFQRGELLWLAISFQVYIAVGLIKFPARDALQLQAQRHLKRGDEPGQLAIEVEVEIDCSGPSVPCMQVIDGLPAGVKVISGMAGMTTSIGRGGKETLKYSFLERRGHYVWKSIHVRIGDPLGLLFLSLDLPAVAELSVSPEQEKYSRLLLKPASTLHAPGSISAHRPGSGTDFWGIREYQPGDPLRWLDWRLNARHPGQLFTREFEQEEAADIGLILDARRETDPWLGEASLFEHSVRAAASLAEAFIHQGNRVSMLVMGKTIIRVYPGYGKFQLNRIMHSLSGVTSSSTGRLLGLQYLPLEMFSSRAMLVVISPLAWADSHFFRVLRARGFHAMLVSPDPYDFIYPSLEKDKTSHRAYYLAHCERRIQLQGVARLGIQVIDWQVTQPLFPLLRSSLGHLRGQGQTRMEYGA